ncbi:MAG: PhnA domain-containing protein [Chitinophagaceae bacterium]|nr:PhnA domain-containing protein [Chitinophagaceae bacterium]
MKQEELLAKRSGNQCELCGATGILKVYEVPPATGNMEDAVLLCPRCLVQIEKKEELNSTHWQCLTTSMWNEVPAVHVMAWRMLNRLRNESWAAENLEMMYLDDERLAWAKASGDHESDGAVDLHKDCYGVVLQNGDTVILTKSLDVKGSTLNAKLGTVVRNIRLVPDNTGQIEGKIEGQTIVVLTKYLRKQNN